MKQTPSGKWFTTTVYLSEDLVTALEARRDEMAEERPGLRVTLSDVMRIAITKGLDDDE